MTTTLEQLNQMDQAAFIALLGGVYEHSPWVAERTWQQRPFADQAALLQSMQQVLAQATNAEQLALIRAHPDLAGKAALRGELTAESTQEQAGASLDQCSAEELAQFHSLNQHYKQRFDFPFIMAVKNANKMQILQGFQQRIDNTPAQEFQTALTQINRIAAFRVATLIE